MVKIVKLSLLTSALLMASSCAVKIKNFDQYQKAPLVNAEKLPTKDQLSSGIPYVVFGDFTNSGIKFAEKSNLSSSLSSEISNALIQEKLVNVVSRSKSQALLNELKIKETNGTGAYKGPSVADYVITGTITNASFTSKRIAEKKTINSSGKSTVTPSKDVYTAMVDAARRHS